MGGDEDGAQAVGFGAEEGGLVHSETVAMQAEYQHMPRVGIDLRAGKDQDAVTTGQLSGGVRRPEIIVLRDADAVQSGGSRRVHQLVGGHKTVVRLGVGVGVEVYEHGCFISQRHIGGRSACVPQRSRRNNTTD